jgi:hypothetical protein
MSQEYYTKIWQHVNEDASDVLGWALQRDLSRFNPFAAPPQTEAGRQMAELARPVDEQLIVEAIKERAFPFDFKVWFSSEVLHRLGRALQVRPPGPQALRQLVERHGGAYLRINCMDENGQRTKRAVFIFDDVQENLGSLSEKELDAMAQAESKRRLDRARERREQDEAGIEVAKKAALRLVKDIG